VGNLFRTYRKLKQDLFYFLGGQFRLWKNGNQANEISSRGFAARFRARGCYAGYVIFILQNIFHRGKKTERSEFELSLFGFVQISTR